MYMIVSDWVSSVSLKPGRNEIIYGPVGDIGFILAISKLVYRCLIGVFSPWAVTWSLVGVLMAAVSSAEPASDIGKRKNKKRKRIEKSGTCSGNIDRFRKTKPIAPV